MAGVALMRGSDLFAVSYLNLNLSNPQYFTIFFKNNQPGVIGASSRLSIGDNVSVFVDLDKKVTVGKKSRYVFKI